MTYSMPFKCCFRMQFGKCAAEDIQIPDEQDSGKQDCTEEPSEASEVKSPDKHYTLCILCLLNEINTFELMFSGRNAVPL